MELKEVCGEELWKQVEQKITEANVSVTDELKKIRFADLSEGGYISKEKYTTLEAEKSNLERQLGVVNTSLKKFEKFKDSDPEKMQGEISTLKTDLENKRKEMENFRKESALKDKLREAGVLDADYVIYKRGGLDKFTFDTEGKPVGVEELLTPLKKESPHLFKKNPGSDYTPNGGGKPLVNNPFAKDTFNLTEQGRMLRDDPARAKQLAAAAGVTI